MYNNQTFHERRHIERLTRSLHDILRNELGAPIPLKACCGAVVYGLALSRDQGAATSAFKVGRPWSTMAALYFLAGRGFVFDPRLALEALGRLERRHIIDRRRLVEREPRHRGASRERTPTPISRQALSRRAVA